MEEPKPSNSLKDVKELIRNKHVVFNPNALSDAWDDFGWRPEKIRKCLLKLNDKYHKLNRKQNHFHKTEQHDQISAAMVDYYKAVNIMEGASIYTHFYIQPKSGMLIVSSFKEL